jgi:hypothetical protein
MVPVLQAEAQDRERESKNDQYRPVMLPPACQDEHNAREGYQEQAKDIPWPAQRAGLGHLGPSAVVSLALIGHSNLRQPLRSSSSACRWVSQLRGYSSVLNCPALRSATCGLSGRAHDVWSPGGPRIGEDARCSSAWAPVVGAVLPGAKILRRSAPLRSAIVLDTDVSSLSLRHRLAV